METTQTAASTISREKFTTFVSALIEGYPNPDGDPQPPGPWDPYIRQAIEKVFGPFPEPWRTPFESVFGPFPQPWRTRFETANERLRNLACVKPEVWDVIGNGSWENLALNPQPPRWAVALEFVRVVAERLVLIQETADVIFPKSLVNEALGAEFAAVGKKLIDTGLERI